MLILTNLRQVESELFDEKHPLANEPLELREAYAIGYAMLVSVNGYPSEQAKELLKKQVVLLGLPGKFKKAAITAAMEADPVMIRNFLNLLNDAHYKYIFMLDLYDYALKDHVVTENEQEFLVLFERLLQLSDKELQFIRGFRLAMLKKDTEIARNVVQAAFDKNITLSLKALRYFLPTFDYWQFEHHDDAPRSVYRAKRKE